ncbi:MAG TPA: phosphodiester glycosidase family protein, partial [Candidatus Sulfotelmatobacter sp.]|nr:phosphodiester glycosidase family protein [Candidatus Sulfotelmatobacter sp.]
RQENSVIMYTPAWGEYTGTDTKGVELTVVDSVVQGIQLGNSPIPPNGYVISLSGPATQFVSDNLKTGNKIEMHIRVVPYNTAPTSILHMVSGGPRLVKNGITYVSKDEERFKADIAQGRAARTAVGIGRDDKVILVTVDGLPRTRAARSAKNSIGMTLEELADLMINLGCVEAMNLDGGGSTTMWIDGRVVNQPAGGSQVRVSNALVVTPKPR